LAHQRYWVALLTQNYADHCAYADTSTFSGMNTNNCCSFAISCFEGTYNTMMRINKRKK